MITMKQVLKAITIILFLSSCGRNEIKINLELSEGLLPFAWPIELNDTTVIIDEAGQINVGKTRSGVVAGYKILDDSMNIYSIYWDSNGDRLIDYETETIITEDSMTSVFLPVKGWPDRANLEYMVSARKFKDQSVGISIRPNYYMSGSYRFGENEYDIKLNDLLGKAEFNINDSKTGTNLGIRKRGLDNYEFSKTEGLIKIEGKYYRVKDIPPDGSYIILKESGIDVPTVGERFSALDAKGSAIGNIALQPGKYTLFQFWSTRCAVCIMKLPDLEKWAAENRDRVDIIGICVENSANFERAQKILEKNGIGWLNYYIEPADPFWLISGAIGEEYHYFFPRYVMVDENGIIVDDWSSDPDYNEFLESIK